MARDGRLGRSAQLKQKRQKRADYTRERDSIARSHETDLEIEAKARACLFRHDALDLIPMLGLEEAA